MRILLACEESQAVTIALRAFGHEAYSCDVVACSGGHPEWHLQEDVLEVLDRGWDMMIAFPPCTHLANSGAKHFAAKRADGRQQAGIDFFLRLAEADIPRIAVENPRGIMSRVYRKPDQVIQPWEYGHRQQKSTCLWLKNLPRLRPTEVVGKGEFYISPKGRKLPKWYSDNTNPANRSKTFPGIARAMAEQWGSAFVEYGAANDLLTVYGKQEAA